MRNGTVAKINDDPQKLMGDKNHNIEEKYILKKHYSDEIQDTIKTKERHLPDKQYVERNSLLTDLFKIKSFQTIYNIFLAFSFGLFVNTIAYDLLQKGEMNWGLKLLFISFAHLPNLLFIWTYMFLSTLIVYIGFYLWAAIRRQQKPKSLALKIWDKLCLALFLIYIPYFMYFHTSSITQSNLSLTETTTALFEMTRLLMKSYAFVRSNAPRILHYKLHSEDQVLLCPEFGKFLYFLFCPTLIYQDNYPRTNRINWKFVITCFAEVLGCILCVSFIIERSLIRAFKDYGLKPYKWQDVTLLILENGMAGLLILLINFYCLLHAWMNGFAEMLKFGDRLFYEDWWTSTTYAMYHRKWNLIVNDWLYTYIYKDMYKIVYPKNKVVAKFMVFFISALFHDFIVSFTLKFYLPVVFVMFFCIGLPMTFLKCGPNNSLGNTAIWYSMTLGTGTLISIYTVEYFARLNCPIKDETFINYFIPRFITCNI